MPGTCVLLEPDSGHLLPTPALAGARVGYLSCAGWRLASLFQGLKRSRHCVLRSQGSRACCQRGTDSARDWHWQPPRGVLQAPGCPREPGQETCFLCCIIKLSFAFEFPGPVIIQAVLAKVLGPCSFELQGQLWRNPAFPAARLLPSGVAAEQVQTWGIGPVPTGRFDGALSHSNPVRGEQS